MIIEFLVSCGTNCYSGCIGDEMYSEIVGVFQLSFVIYVGAHVNAQKSYLCIGLIKPLLVFSRNRGGAVKGQRFVENRPPH